MSVRDRLASFIGRTPPDDAPEYDAHTWDDTSKPSLRERLTPSSQRSWAITVSTVTIGIGLGVCFLRFLPVRDIVIPTISIALLPWAPSGRVAGFVTASVISPGVSCSTAAAPQYGSANLNARANAPRSSARMAGFSRQPSR